MFVTDSFFLTFYFHFLTTLLWFSEEEEKNRTLACHSFSSVSLEEVFPSSFWKVSISLERASGHGWECWIKGHFSLLYCMALRCSNDGFICRAIAEIMKKVGQVIGVLFLCALCKLARIILHTSPSLSFFYPLQCHSCSITGCVLWGTDECVLGSVSAHWFV